MTNLNTGNNATLKQTFKYDNLGNLTGRSDVFTTPSAATINESHIYNVLGCACALRTLAFPWDNLSMSSDWDESISLGYAYSRLPRILAYMIRRKGEWCEG